MTNGLIDNDVSDGSVVLIIEGQAGAVGGRREASVEDAVSVHQIRTGDDEQENGNGKAVDELGPHGADVQLGDGQRRIDQRIVAREIVAHDAVARREGFVALDVRWVAAAFHVGLQTGFVEVKLAALIR